jgi:hypothetical protein
MKIPSLDKLAKLQGYLDARVVRDEKSALSDKMSEHLQRLCEASGTWDDSTRLVYLKQFHKTLN